MSILLQVVLPDLDQLEQAVLGQPLLESAVSVLSPALLLSELLLRGGGDVIECLHVLGDKVDLLAEGDPEIQPGAFKFGLQGWPVGGQECFLVGGRLLADWQLDQLGVEGAEGLPGAPH